MSAPPRYLQGWVTVVGDCPKGCGTFICRISGDARREGCWFSTECEVCGVELMPVPWSAEKVDQGTWSAKFVHAGASWHGKVWSEPHDPAADPRPNIRF